MDKGGFKVRLMVGKDFDAVVGIDEKVVKARREPYYELKFEKLVQSTDYVPTSLVVENSEGRVVGFIMGELFIGEYGINSERATLDTLGVDPEYRHAGLGRLLMEEFVDHLKSLGVEKINTLVDSGDEKFTGFFTTNGFAPSNTVNLERDLRKKGGGSSGR